jgi:hypothetical protein
MAYNDDVVCEIALLERPEHQLDIVRVVFDEQDGSVPVTSASVGRTEP